MGGSTAPRVANLVWSGVLVNGADVQGLGERAPLDRDARPLARLDQSHQRLRLLGRAGESVASD